MKVKRIVANIASMDLGKAQKFYGEILGLDKLMDHGWITTYGSTGQQQIQVSIASDGGSGTTVPDFSIEVDNLDEALDRMKAADIPIEYGPVDEPWGVRRFFARDPFGKLVNILTHS